MITPPDKTMLSALYYHNFSSQPSAYVLTHSLEIGLFSNETLYNIIGLYQHIVHFAHSTKSEEISNLKNYYISSLTSEKNVLVIDTIWRRIFINDEVKDSFVDQIAKDLKFSICILESQPKARKGQLSEMLDRTFPLKQKG